MTREEATAFASEWAGAWNELAVERVLAHFSEDVVFTSPTALAVAGVGTLRGKQALRAYWATALERIGSLRFAVDRVVWDADTRELAIIYVSEIDGRTRRVSENLTFGLDGLVVSAEVFHGVGG
jgi:ketosteroid isomerase-like protein